MAEGDVATEKPKDWKRPAAWAIAAFSFFAILTPIADRTVDTASERIMASLLIGFGYAVLFGIAGTVRTLLSRRESDVMIPFVSATSKRSLAFFVASILGMAMKAFLSGFIVWFVGFAALGSLWVTRKDYFHHGLDVKD